MQQIINILLEHLVEIVFTILGILVTTYIVPWLKEKKLYETVKIIVQAAEKIAQSNKINKKAWVVSNLESIGITVNEHIEAMIESAVEEIDAAFGTKKAKKV